jgi:hypothetical protein
MFLYTHGKEKKRKEEKKIKEKKRKKESRNALPAADTFPKARILGLSELLTCQNCAWINLILSNAPKLGDSL